MNEQIDPKRLHTEARYRGLIADHLADPANTIHDGGLIVVTGTSNATRFAEKLGFSRTLLNQQGQPYPGQNPAEAFIERYSDLEVIGTGTALRAPITDPNEQRRQTLRVVDGLKDLEPHQVAIIFEAARQALEASEISLPRPE